MRTRFDTVFRISLIIKGLDAALEIIGGALLLFVTPGDIMHLVNWLTRSELAADPHDFTSNLLVHLSHSLTASSTTFAAIYLLSHGLVKIFVVINVLRNKYWAYPLLVVVLVGFIVYQLIRIGHTHSIGVIVLTVFDLFVLAMTGLEWRKQIILRREEAAS